MACLQDSVVARDVAGELTEKLLARHASGYGSNSVTRRTRVLLFSGFSALLLLALQHHSAIRPAQHASVSARLSSQTQTESKILTASVDLHQLQVPGWWNACDVRGPFCDMRRNIRDELDYESRWAFTFLEGLSEKTVALYISFFNKLHQHINEVNANRSTHCPLLHSWEEHQAYWKRQGFHVGLTGRAVANYVNSVHAKFKKASDAIHEASGAPPTCAWQSGQPGWGADMTALEQAIKGHGRDKFMWTQEKGRGSALDKAAMVTGVERTVVTEEMGQKFDVLFQATRGEDAYYREMPAWKQRLLPGLVRWGNTFRNFNFGLFSYGDGDEWTTSKTVKHFFYNDIVHGFAVHGRNLTRGNPAERSREVGMPWVGGVSGSLIDFYLAARNLGFKGEELATLMVVDVACLIAGGQHSLGELLFAAAEAELEGGDLSFEKDGERFTYFATPQFRQLVHSLNLPPAQWAAATATTSLPALYGSGLAEFVRRAGPEGFGRREGTVAEELRKYGEAPDLEPCLQLPGIVAFKTGVYASGGPTQAFDIWETDGLQDFSDGLTPEEFVMKIAPTFYNQAIVYCQVAFDEISGVSHAGPRRNITKSMFDSYANGETHGNEFVVQLMKSLRGRIAHNLWGSSTAPGPRSEVDFSAAVVGALDDSLLEVFRCVVSRSKQKTAMIDLQNFQSVYAMAWLS